MNSSFTPLSFKKTRRILSLALTTMLLSVGYQAQAQNAAQYGFSSMAGTFTPNVGGTVVSAIHADDAATTGIPIGFAFTFCGIPYTTVSPCSNGWMSFNSVSSSYLSNALGSLGSIAPCVMPMWDDLSGGAGYNSIASYLTSGTAPNRVFTMEWKDWRWYYGNSNSISFQVKLFETTNIIQCVYTPTSNSVTNGSATVGIAKNGSDYLVLNNTTAAPIPSSSNFVTTISSPPPAGQIYQWSPPSPCTGTPLAGAAVSTPSAVCQGTSASLSISGGSIATGLTFQWEEFNGTIWVNAVGGFGATTANYTSPNLTSPKQYRVKITCTTSNITSFSAPVNVTINISSLPYIETFESITANNQLPNCMSSTNLGSSTYTYTTNQSSWNQINHTIGGSKFGSFRYGANDWFFSPNLPLVANQDYLISFWYITDGLSGWQTIEAKLGMGANPGAMTITAGTPVSNPMNTTYQQYSAVVRVTATGNYNLGIHCIGNFSPWYVSIDDIGVQGLPPCTGTPVAGVINPTGTQTGCPGSVYNLTTTGSSVAAGLTYQWLQSTNAAPAYVPVIGGIGGTTLNYTTPPLSDTIRYRLRVTCNNSNLSDNSGIVTFNVPKPTYTSLPVVESFENWGSRCGTNDIPTASWSNIPFTGNNSWRREDQGTSANWLYETSGNLNQTDAFHGLHFARFHVYQATPNQPGDLSLYVDCSSITGNKELQFHMRTDPSIYAYDTLKVFESTDGGLTFTQIGIFGSGTTGWQMHTLPITSNSATTVIKFSAASTYTYYNDINLDYVRVLPPCNATPNAGTINPVTPCKNTEFPLVLNNSTQAAGLLYQWQKSATGYNNWTNIPGGTTAAITQNINVATYYRAIVTCANTNQSDTTPIYKVNIQDFFYCYCNSAAAYAMPVYTFPYEDIGNFTIKTVPGDSLLLSNGSGTPLTNNLSAGNSYTNFTAIAPTTLYHDSTYKFIVQQVSYNTNANSRVAIYLDMNRNGEFEASEKIYSQGTTSPLYKTSANFTIPNTALTGVTGMRVILWRGAVDAPPCGIYNYYGETEDYLVNISYPPCSGAVNPGTAFINKISTCVGYTINLGDTTYEKTRSEINRLWQFSTNGGFGWNNLPNSANKDTLNKILVSGPTQYRLRVICNRSGDTTYSNVVSVAIKESYKCYCVSYAAGGEREMEDISDIGFFRVGPYAFNTGGPHLLNPAALRDRTDNTDVTGINLYADSTYGVDFYHIILPGNQADAKVTMFIDYNNNQIYDVPQERVFSGIMDSVSFYRTAFITIPNAVVPDVPTGMRVIINNNTAPNVQSDNACGVYASGETEDYVVTLKRAYKTGVASTNSTLLSLAVYPNPNSGIFTVRLNGTSSFKDVNIAVMNMSGQRVASRSFGNTSTTLATDFNLSQFARGIYFVEVRADGEKMIRKLVIQ